MTVERKHKVSDGYAQGIIMKALHTMCIGLRRILDLHSW